MSPPSLSLKRGEGEVTHTNDGSLGYTPPLPYSPPLTRVEHIPQESKDGKQKKSRFERNLYLLCQHQEQLIGESGVLRCVLQCVLQSVLQCVLQCAL